MERNPDFSEIKAVIFDMDGVLFLANDLHAQAFQEVLTPLGITDFSYPSIAGMRTDESFKKIFKQNQRTINNQDLEALVKEKQSRVLELLENNPPIAPESKTLIPYLQKRYRLALASSASKERIELFLRESNYGNAFTFYLHGDDVAHAKPAPDIYLLAAQQLNLSPKDCIVIEDAINGIQAAVAADMRAIAVIGAENSEPFLQAGADVVVSGLKEIASLL